MSTEERPPLKVDLRLTSTRAGLPGGDDKGGKGFVLRAVWLFVNALVFQSAVVPSYGLKRWILRKFGAKIGKGVLVKPSVNIKYPWMLEIGEHSWIGEGVWLDCTAPLKIGKHVAISQGAYIACGLHDWQDPGMGSMVAPVVVEDGVWIASCARIAGNVTIGQEAMVALGSVVFNDCEPRSIYRGNPAQRIGGRRIRDYPGPRRPKTARQGSTAPKAESAP